MLKKLIIENYQSHKRTVMRFSPHVNVIIGPPQSGKSAILRAFRWVVFNRPRGFRFNSWFAKKKGTRVKAVFDNCVVQKSKLSASKNEYLLIKDGRKDTFSGFKDKVPEPISNAINITDLNIQTQLNQFFIINDSPSEIARTINKITRIEKVDTEWMPKLVKMISTHRQEISILDDDVKDIKDQLRKYKEVERVLKKIERAEYLQDKVDKLDEAIREMQDLEKEAKEVSGVDKMFMLLGRANAGVQYGFRLRSSIKEIDAKLNEYIRINDNIEDTADAYRKKKVDYKESKEELITALQEMKICPLCFSKLDNDAIRKLLEQI